MLKSDMMSQIKLMRKSVTEFDGVKIGLSKEPGKLSGAKNVYCDTLGVHTLPARRTLRSIENGAAIGSDGNLFWIENRRVYYNGYPIEGLYLTEGEKKLISFGGYLLIFPDGVYLSLFDTSKFGNLHASLSSSGNVTLKNCGPDLVPIESFSVLEKAPENAAFGEYRAVSDGSGYKMLRYDGYNWKEIETYVRIELPSCGDIFNIGDAITVSGQDINCEKSFNISHISGDYIYYSGCAVNLNCGKLTFTRHFPMADHAALCGGRLCLCRYGVDRSGNYVRRFYASGVGNPFDFTPSPLGGAVWADVAGSGEFLGIADFDGSAVLFSDGELAEITVGSSGRTTVSNISCDSIENGAEKSAAYVGNSLYFKGKRGVYCYSGGSVKCVSDDLGFLKISSNGSPAVSYNGKYYLCAESNGTPLFLSYDTSAKKWSISDDEGISSFTVRRGVLYALSKGENSGDSLIIVDTSNLSESELDYCSDGVERESKALPWSFESGMFCFDDLKGIYPVFVSLRMEKITGNAKMSIICDFDTEASETINLPRSGVYTVPLKKRKCDTVRLRFFGDGEFTLNSLMLGYTSESEERI